MHTLSSEPPGYTPVVSYVCVCNAAKTFLQDVRLHILAPIRLKAAIRPMLIGKFSVSHGILIGCDYGYDVTSGVVQL